MTRDEYKTWILNGPDCPAKRFLERYQEQQRKKVEVQQAARIVHAPLTAQEQAGKEMVERMKRESRVSPSGPGDNSDLWAMRDDLPATKAPAREPGED